MRIGIFDIETNGLFHEVTHFWCAWVLDINSKKKVGFRPHQLQELCEYLAEFDVVIGHNIIDYDCKALKKLYPCFKTKAVFDTLVLSRMLDPDKITGHSLKAWGKELGILKGEYGEQEEAWDKFTEDMYIYCEQDVMVTEALYFHLCTVAGFDPFNPPCTSFDWELK